jgi:hypothetical protein
MMACGQQRAQDLTTGVLVPLPRNSYTMAKPFKWTYAGKP